MRVGVSYCFHGLYVKNLYRVRSKSQRYEAIRYFLIRSCHMLCVICHFEVATPSILNYYSEYTPKKRVLWPPIIFC